VVAALRVAMDTYVPCLSLVSRLGTTTHSHRHLSPSSSIGDEFNFYLVISLHIGCSVSLVVL